MCTDDPKLVDEAADFVRQLNEPGSQAPDLDTLRMIEEINIILGVNERGVGMITGCLASLEQKLGELLKSRLRSGSITASLLGHNGGELGTLFSRSRMLYALSIIEKDLLQELSTLGEIRNRCAHDSNGLPFEQAEIHELCSKLKLPARVADQFPPSAEEAESDIKLSKYLFRWSVLVCSTLLDRELKR